MEPLLAATVKYLALECARLEQELNTDALTGCKSQRAFLKRAREQTSTEGITVMTNWDNYSKMFSTIWW